MWQIINNINQLTIVVSARITIFIAIIHLVMATNELKRCVYRILGDLTKSDNVISVGEMDTLDRICDNMKITPIHKNESYSLTLADAVNYVAKQDRTVGARIVKLMEECALKDGECCRAEALLISAVEIVNDSRGQILSMPFSNRPILSTQIVYVDSSRDSASRRNELDKNYEELSRIAEMAGFELIYIPHVAKEFKEFKRKKDLERLLSIVNPTLTPNAISNKVMSLQEMDNRYFYLRVLNERLQMGLSLSCPVWLIRLPNSVVNGIGYANFLCYNIEMGDIKKQLIEWVDGVNNRQTPYSILVNRHSDRSKDFLYGGFHKALLDVMASDKVEPWEVKVYVRAGLNPVIDKSETGKKFSVEICKGSTAYPVLINGREAAFYLLLLCGSASSQRGIDFEYDRERSKKVQAQFIEAYHLVSNRDEHFPDITLSSTFRPIKTKVMKGLEECGIKGELHLFKPSKTGKNTYYIPVNPDNVKIISQEGSTPLLDSAIYQAFCKHLGK